MAGSVSSKLLDRMRLVSAGVLAVVGGFLVVVSLSAR